MNQPKFSKEYELAVPVADWLTGQGLKVYHEVCHGSVRYDLVAVEEKSNRIVIVELKLTRSAKLMIQCSRALNFAHMVYAATPEARSDNIGFLSKLKRMGVGLLEVGSRIDILIEPTFHFLPSRRFDDLHDYLRDEQMFPEKNGFALAGSGGGHVTDFALTRQRIVDFVRGNPGLKMIHVFGAVKHHYATQKTGSGCFRKLIKRGIITELRFDRNGGVVLNE